MRDIRSMTLLAAVTLLGPACGGPTLIPEEERKGVTFEEFRATAYKEPDSEVYIVNGDEAVEGLQGLREYFDRFVQPEPGKREDALTAYCLNGVHVKWSATQARNLTYCVSSSSFGSRYSTVVSAMNSAAAAWEAAANVNFIHASSYDSNCTASQTNVVFDVRQVTGGSYLARAFFPNASRSGRNLLIDSSAFGNVLPWTLTGLLRHELGHTLGFRHEHVRVGSTTCPEEISTACPLTAYDPNSVMHYPQCGGTNSDLMLTSLDQEGARAYYP